MKRKSIDAKGLDQLRELVSERYTLDGGTELEWKSYLPRYEDLNSRIRTRIQGDPDAAISPNILRRLFWDTLKADSASFNVVYLNGLTRYGTQGQDDYKTFQARSSSEPSYVPTESDEEKEHHALQEHPPRIASTDQVVDRISTDLPTIWPSGSTAKKPELLASAPEAGPVTFRSILRPFLIAAVYSGLLSFAFVLLLNEISGYESFAHGDLRRLMVSWFGFTIFGHLALGVALAYGTYRLYTSVNKERSFTAFYKWLPLLFVLTFYGRQLFVSSGWLVNGRNAAGFFGKPDFETLAITLSLCGFITLFLNKVRRRGTTKGGSPIWWATSNTLICGTIFFIIAAAYNILVTEGAIDPNGWFIAPHVFSYRFPHPERLPLICFMVFIQTLLSFRSFAEHTAVIGYPRGTQKATSTQLDHNFR